MLIVIGIIVGRASVRMQEEQDRPPPPYTFPLRETLPLPERPDCIQAAAVGNKASKDIGIVIHHVLFSFLPQSTRQNVLSLTPLFQMYKCSKISESASNPWCEHYTRRQHAQTETVKIPQSSRHSLAKPRTPSPRKSTLRNALKTRRKSTL